MSCMIFELNCMRMTINLGSKLRFQNASAGFNKRLITSPKLLWSCVSLLSQSESYSYQTDCRFRSSFFSSGHRSRFKSSSHHNLVLKRFNFSSHNRMSDKVACDTIQAGCPPVSDVSVEVKETKEDELMSQSKDEPQNLSKRALKRQARAQKFKELKRKKKADNSASGDQFAAGYSADAFDETSYYFENGLRKVYPYHYVFSTHAKGRWVGRTLGEVLENEFGSSHPTAVERAFKEKRVYVNNHLVRSDYLLKDCDFISHHTHRHENPVTGAPIEVIENNSDVIVINKPSSIPCHPCGRYRYNSLIFILGKEMGCSNLRNIYRLDRLTSGVLIMGKTAKSTKLLEDQVLNREVQKEYVCRVTGEFPSETITVDQPLKALSNKLRLQVISPNGKPSQTTFQRLSYNGHSSVVRCIPHTGRTHQIRVHLQYLGHPILNDAFYNSTAWGPCKGKGGVYEVPHEITCAQIYEGHQANLWEGEDNPLYYEKLRQESNGSETGNNGKEDGQSTHSKESALPNTVESTDKCSVIFPPSASTVTEKPDSDKQAITQMRPMSDDQRDQTDECSLLAPNISESKEEISSCSRPTFEASKWIVDTSCDMCRKTTVEPQKKDLVMFLHALKYKGPGWEYETKLPDWAKEDWNREDEFSI